MSLLSQQAHSFNPLLQNSIIKLRKKSTIDRVKTRTQTYDGSKTVYKTSVHTGNDGSLRVDTARKANPKCSTEYGHFRRISVRPTLSSHEQSRTYQNLMQSIVSKSNVHTFHLIKRRKKKRRKYTEASLQSQSVNQFIDDEDHGKDFIKEWKVESAIQKKVISNLNSRLMSEHPDSFEVNGQIDRNMAKLATQNASGEFEDLELAKQMAIRKYKPELYYREDEVFLFSKAKGKIMNQSYIETQKLKQEKRQGSSQNFDIIKVKDSEFCKSYYDRYVRSYKERKNIILNPNKKEANPIPNKMQRNRKALMRYQLTH